MQGQKIVLANARSGMQMDALPRNSLILSRFLCWEHTFDMLEADCEEMVSLTSLASVDAELEAGRLLAASRGVATERLSFLPASRLSEGVFSRVSSARVASRSANLVYSDLNSTSSTSEMKRGSRKQTSSLQQWDLEN